MAYSYKNGQLTVGSQTVASLVQPYHGPTYVYDLDDVRMRFDLYLKAFEGLQSTLHYAMKSNSNPILLQRLAQWGAGVDTVSAGEIKKALAAGFAPSKIIFSGVAKTKREIEYAIANKIKQINIESPAELQRIIDIAKSKSTKVDVAFRMNPDVNPKTHPYITTGFRENKFGMDESFLPELIAMLKSAPHVRLRGLTMHIGSLLFDLDVMREAMEKTLAVHAKLLEHGFQLDRFDVGGGLGIRYETDDVQDELEMLARYGAMLKDVVSKHLPASCEILAEPGRILVARAGLLVTEVQYIKRAPAKTFAIVDTGMHHLLRPALYQAKHRVLLLSHDPAAAKKSFDVVGPICESSDVLAKNIELPEVKEGDLLAIADAGAYGYSMASTYNSHELPREIAIENDHVIDARSGQPT